MFNRQTIVVEKMNRWMIVVEKKVFTVETAKDVVEVCEKSKNFHASVGLEVILARWLMQKLKRLISGDLQLVFMAVEEVRTWISC